jgi:type IV pilus assembly protein PilW
VNAMSPNSSNRPTQAGLTLVELMISLALGLLLFLTVIAIYLNSRQSFNAQSNLARMQEGARVAIDVLSREVRAAGFMGCANAGLSGNNAIPVPIKAYASLADYNADTGNPSLDSTSFSNIQAPILLVRHGANTSLPVSGAMSGGTTGDIPIASAPAKWKTTPPALIVSDCVGADLFTPTSVTDTAIAHGALNRTYGADARVTPLEASVFFVAQPAGRTYTSLYQRFNNGASMQDLRSADDVSQWVLRFGYGATDANVTGYADVAEINALSGTWSTVKTVRVNLLLTSRLPVLDRPAPYIFNFSEVAAPADRLLRKEFATTIGLRNRITSTH